MTPSRYYDPEVGRFINADNISMLGANGDFASLNLYAYCGNNPIVRADVDGHAWETIFDIITLGSSVIEVIAKPTDMWAWAGLIGDVVDLIPFVTGVGETVKTVRVTVKVVDGLGDLSKAKKYGIKAYNALKRALKGTGLQAHHIIEQRLVKHLGINVSNMLSVALTAKEHQKFTNAWRKLIKYGTNYSQLSVDDILEAAKQVYKDYPDLLKAAIEILKGE